MSVVIRLFGERFKLVCFGFLHYFHLMSKHVRVVQAHTSRFKVFPKFIIYTRRGHHALRSKLSIPARHPTTPQPNKPQQTLATTISLRVVLSLTTSRRRRDLVRRVMRAMRAMATLIPPTLLLLAMLVVRRRSTLAPFPLSIDDRSKVQQAHDGSTHGISNDGATLRASQLQTEATVHHAEHDGDAANANVSVRYGRATAVLLERAVVQPTSERLREERDEQHDADDRVCASEVLLIHGDPDADAEGDDVDEEAEDL
jgi:hypothetical protein